MIYFFCRGAAAIIFYYGRQRELCGAGRGSPYDAAAAGWPAEAARGPVSTMPGLATCQEI